ncbi:MAG: hypothetical protein JWM48_1943 [Mycobacterium sp.]|nr:hypothetical protein [Mycobacterium sp.]
MVSMTTTDRAMPPLQADERTTLESWLDFYRTTLVMKCEGLTDEQLRTTSVSPSPLTLLGLLQHMAEVERNWFRRVLLGEQVTPIYDPAADPNGPDGGFELSAGVTFASARATWEEEVAQARANGAARGLDEISPFMGTHVTLRWIYSHMIGEYARHAGHADLIRERIDGATGV